MKKENPDYISELRTPINPPEKLVVDGQAIFGTFDGPLPVMNLLECNHPAGKALPNFFNRQRLTQWEAFEICMKDGILVSAVYNMNAIGFSIHMFFDKRDKSVKAWQNFNVGSKCVCSENLIGGAVTKLVEKKRSSYVLENSLDKKEAHCTAFSTNKKFGTVKFDIDAKSNMPPSVVSIPFGKNMPLYSHKEFFTNVTGSFSINDEQFVIDEDTMVIIDDHKGYYPFKSHYDWLTSMARVEIDGEMKYAGFNLTANQTIDGDKYNENLLWIDGEACPLPPVVISHVTETRWLAKDKYGRVELFFDIDNGHHIDFNLGVVMSKYYMPFGKLTGFIVDNDGRKIVFDGCDGMGEDKSMRI